MSNHETEPTKRFSDRVEDYVRYRPTYPTTVIDFLTEENAIDRASVVADIGAGTGISSRPFLENGNSVIGVEPNAAMRAAAEAGLSAFEKFRAVSGAAEATGLADASIDLIVAGQAFHWFDVPASKREWKRILRPGKRVVLMWNVRRVDSTPFLRDLEGLLLGLGTDYQHVRHERVGPAELASFFGGAYISRSFYNVQELDWAGLRGRMLSSSYVPMAGQRGHEKMIADLHAIYDRHAEADRVRIEYDTEVHLGAIA